MGVGEIVRAGQPALQLALRAEEGAAKVEAQKLQVRLDAMGSMQEQVLARREVRAQLSGKPFMDDYHIRLDKLIVGVCDRLLQITG